MVENETLCLVDYDGLYVPALAGSLPGENGHPNYQHPDRAAKHYGPELDNFFAWVIYGSLAAVAADSSLWTKLGGGDDCLLLRRADFLNPKRSDRIEIMRKSSDPLVRAVATVWITNLDAPPDRVGQLTPLLGEKPSDPRRPWWQVRYTSGGGSSALNHARPSTGSDEPAGKRIDVKTWVPKTRDRLLALASRVAPTMRRHTAVAVSVPVLAAVGIVLGVGSVFGPSRGMGGKAAGHFSSQPEATSLTSDPTTTSVPVLSAVQSTLKREVSASNDVYTGCGPMTAFAQVYQGIGCQEPIAGIKLAYYGVGFEKELTALFDAGEQILVSNHELETCWNGDAKGGCYDGSNAKRTVGQWLCYRAADSAACMQWTNYKNGAYGVAHRGRRWELWLADSLVGQCWALVS